MGAGFTLVKKKRATSGGDWVLVATQEVDETAGRTIKDARNSGVVVRVKESGYFQPPNAEVSKLFSEITASRRRARKTQKQIDRLKKKTDAAIAKLA